MYYMCYHIYIYMHIRGYYKLACMPMYSGWYDATAQNWINPSAIHVYNIYIYVIYQELAKWETHLYK